MRVVAFATDRGFGHWSRVRNYLTLPSLRGNSILIAPIAPASQSWNEVNTLGFVDPGDRFILEDDGRVVRVTKFESGINFKANLTQYYALPWAVAFATQSSTIIIDAHNEPELLYAGELLEECRAIVDAAYDRGLKRTVFTLETQRFNVLPKRYQRAFEKCDLILVPHELEFFRRCVPLEPFDEFKHKMKFFGNVISPDSVKVLRTPRGEARAALGLPERKTIVFCTYGRGEGAMDLVSTIARVGANLTARNKDLMFVVSDPDGEFREALPARDWLHFLGLDYQKALLTLAACDCTIQGLGTSTLLESLVAGKRLIAISLDRPYEEQASKGRAVQSLGLGVYLPLSEVSERRIEEGLLQTLEGERGDERKALRSVLGDLQGAERIASELSREP